MLCVPRVYHVANRNVEQRHLVLQKELDKQRARARRSEDSLKAAELKIQELEKLRTHMQEELNELEADLDQAQIRVDHFRRQLRNLRSETKCNPKSIHAAIQKLTLSPAVAKRIAAAIHPDKCPRELCDSATELFRYVQSIREQGQE